MLVCQIKHKIIRNSWFHFSNIGYKVTILPEMFDNLSIYAFVSDEFHFPFSAMG